MQDYLIILNPNVAQRKLVIRKIKDNDGFCISQPKSSTTKCHCKHFKETGECLCGIFVNVPVVEVTEP